jgi:hypothetical protein
MKTYFHFIFIDEVSPGSFLVQDKLNTRVEKIFLNSEYRCLAILHTALTRRRGLVVFTPDSYREALGSNLGPETGHPD